jgi:hypothetical protein
MRRKNRLQVLCQSAGGEPLPLLVQSDGKAVINRYLRDSPFGQGGFSKRRGSATDRQHGSGRKTALAPAEEEGTNGIRGSGPILTKGGRWISGIFPWPTMIVRRPGRKGLRPGNRGASRCSLWRKAKAASRAKAQPEAIARSNRCRLLYLRQSYDAPAQAIVGVVFFAAASNTWFPR